MVFFATRGLLGPSGTNAGDIDVGTEVILNENGQPVNYLIVNQGIPENSPLYDASCDGTWLLRKDIRELGAWNASGVNTLPGSTIMTTMAGYVDDYDPKVQEAIKTVKIPYCVGNGSATVNSGANGLECKVFPLGAYEVGFRQVDSSSLPIDGSKLQYFESFISDSANQKRVAYMNGSPVKWSLRAVYTVNTMAGFCCDQEGALSGALTDDTSQAIRPALILPYDFKFTSDQIAA